MSGDYRMSTRLTESGTVVRESEQDVDAAYVERYVGARSFFEGIGGTEVHTRTPDGGIHVTATSPDGLSVRETTFLPA
jgi:hypothetical protein